MINYGGDLKMNDSLGDRMKKNYEDRTRFKLIRRTPVIIRLDGKAFHTLTRGMEKPFSNKFADDMAKTAMYLCGEIQGAKLAYVQSDEISILLTDFDRLNTDAWFDYNLQKLVSVSASMASVYFNELGSKTYAFFDSRAFNLPKEEVANYFVWRQKDWIRNSVSLLAQANFSHKQLQGKNQYDMKLMLLGKEVDWEELNLMWKYGRIVANDSGMGWQANAAPVFTEERNHIEKYLIPVEE